MQLWDYFQALQLDQLGQKAANTNLKANRNIKDVRHLEEKIDALSLVTHAIWELLQENTNVTKRQLEQKIEEIDLRDGKKDGKLAETITHCPDCGHKLSKRRSHCFWCGAKVSNINIINET